ncbi:MAG: hypothetical protein ACYDHH_20475 [Solirubrobacteraceae bacterium]
MAPWAAAWLVRTDAGTRTIPAFSFLLDQPAAVRVQLLAILDAVRSTGPDRWRDTTSHDSMRGACAHLHEARDRHGQMLYRLYLRWQRDERRVVIIDGGAKPNATTMPDAFYVELAALAATIEHDPPPFAVADDFARLALSARADA